MTRYDVMRLLADARPDRLDPDPGSVPDPGTITAHPRTVTTRATRTVTTRATRRTRLVLAGALPVAAAALVAGALVLTNGSPNNPEAGTDGTKTTTARPDPRTASDLLLVAAEQTGSGTATDGRYRVRAYERGERKEVGRYAIMTRNAHEQWLATDPDDPSVEVHQYLGARPATPADEQVWRAAGSPDRWTEATPPGTKKIEHTVAAGPRQVEPLREGARRESMLLAGQPVTEAELAALPTEPAALRTRLVAKLRAGNGQENENYALFYAARGLITDLPVSAQVRAAAYRMLADVPGIELLGKVVDQGGRSGFAVAYTRRGDAGWGQIRLIIDQGTGSVLAEESWFLGSDRSSATLMSFTLVLRTGYTNDAAPTT
ncbi:CU044_5270 family protein [Virgisporangium aurantiacum]|uniref:CU044_5270 family protein n=1 Tax=Virgisporangium aurantiacum TaxID=175570 RepID=A0A8J4E403_9ACTN|nr:CU044_5270 family protein [Virgisporangium aurantiacum]GIJ58512.1 hypothetical protein Vau01_060280 [Virgisporangium aurantiacum]